MARRLAIRLAPVAVLLLTTASWLRAGERRVIPSFGVDVEVVSLNLALSDPGGRPVTGLTEQDVAVFEDGVRQPITTFVQEQWPITLAVLIDGSASMRPVLPTAQAAARKLLQTLGPDDRALVAQFNRRLTVLQDFTSDRAALDRAVGEVAAEGETALYTALYVALKELFGPRTEGRAERQAIVVLSDGRDTASMVDDEQVLELARKADVNIYTVGLPESPAVTASPDFDGSPRYFLSTLARETGGRSFFPASLSDLAGAYDEVATELRTLYGVAYVPTNTARDGSWRRISVRALRPSLVARYRTGYYAPRAARVAQGR
jgi:Ca-activated chloride channel family protein